MRMILCLSLLVVMLMTTSGCGGFYHRPQENVITPDTTPGEVLLQTVQKTDWLVTLSILAVGAGFFAFLNGNGSGVKIMAAALVMLSLTLAVIRYSVIIAGAAVLTAAVLLGYTIYLKSKTIKEIVAGNEQFKSTANSDEAVAAWKAAQSSVQSPTTTAIVDEYKATLEGGVLNAVPNTE